MAKAQARRLTSFILTQHRSIITSNTFVTGTKQSKESDASVVRNAPWTSDLESVVVFAPNGLSRGGANNYIAIEKRLCRCLTTVPNKRPFLYNAFRRHRCR